MVEGQTTPWDGLERRKDQGVEIINLHRRRDGPVFAPVVYGASDAAHPPCRIG